MSTPPDECPYDVFVSYRHVQPEQGWVRDRLVPALRASGVRVCLDVDDFRLGRPLVLEMGRAVEESTYTLVVLTRAYLESTFAELENVLAEHLSLEDRQRRLVVALREPAVPRLGLRALLWVDLTDAEYDAGLSRLTRHLTTAPEW